MKDLEKAGFIILKKCIIFDLQRITKFREKISIGNVWMRWSVIWLWQSKSMA